MKNRVITLGANTQSFSGLVTCYCHFCVNVFVVRCCSSPVLCLGGSGLVGSGVLAGAITVCCYCYLLLLLLCVLVTCVAITTILRHVALGR